VLEAGRLIDAARERTGLRSFGDEWFLEPLGWLLESIDAESRLTETGAAFVPEMLIAHLVNRLELHDWYRRHPEIDDEEIVAPVFGLGMPRTGSTALGHMMGLDPDTRVLRGWESDRHCPPPEAATQDSDPRIAVSQRAEDQLSRLVPELNHMLPRGVTKATECAYPLAESFASGPTFDLFLHVPGFLAKTLSPAFDMVPAYRHHKQVLKLLQWRCPPKRWYLRTPMHSFDIDALHEVYPDARFVMTHREPLRSLSSVCSFIYRYRVAFVENPEPEYLGATHRAFWAEALRRTLAFRDAGREARFHDVSHRRQVVRPSEQVREVYQHFGWRYDETMEERIRVWQQEHPKGKHESRPEFFALDPGKVAEDFRFYTERFAHLL
jgi:hypothetical protein